MVVPGYGDDVHKFLAKSASMAIHVDDEVCLWWHNEVHELSEVTPEDVTMKLKVGDLMKENDDVEASCCYEDEMTTKDERGRWS